MCKAGDIIVVQSYKRGDEDLNRHSFIVLQDEEGQIQGLDYNLICNVMSSFKNEEQKERKLQYPGNFPIKPSDSTVLNGNNKEGYVKTEQFYYFQKENLEYKIIGRINEDVFNRLIKYISELDTPIEDITDNL